MNYKPTITRGEFDEREEDIKAALNEVIAEELKTKEEFTAWLDSDDPDGSDIKPHGGLVVPTASIIDSLTVFKASAAVSEITGAGIHPDDIRDGGWNTFEDLWDDLRPKMKDRCLVKKAELEDDSAAAKVPESAAN